MGSDGMKQTPSKKIISTFESVRFPDFIGVGEMTAKIDTGAYSGALHCTKIRVEETPTSRVLHFSPFDHPETEIITKDFVTSHVRSSNGVNQNRYFINTHIVISGKKYEIALSLADRSEMKWPVLIGRKFLRKNNFLVDAGKRAR